MSKKSEPCFESQIVIFAKETYKHLINHAHRLLLILLTLAISIHASQQGLSSHLHSLHHLLLNLSFLNYITSFSLLTIITKLTFSFLTKPPSVYLLDFACFKPPPSCRVPFATAYEHGRAIMANDPESVAFQVKIYERAGLGEETSLPHQLHYLPPNTSMIGAREEAELVIFSGIDSLLEQTGISPRDIDIVIVNCGLFSPTPSLSSMVVHKYNMRSDVKGYNLSGMGCSAGLIAIDLAKHLLHVHPESNAVVISTETLTPNSYMGRERSMLLPNCIFRMGGATILLTNKRCLRKHAKYRLVHVVRTHRGGEDLSYNCVTQEEDHEGCLGVSLSVDIMVIAAKSLKSNIGRLGTLVLPVSEQLSFLLNLIGRKIFKLQWKPYIPDFRKTIDHFCIHAGGRPVINEVKKNLRLSDEDVEAAIMTLYRFGNTSSSSVWYEMGYIEAKGRMKKGDVVWQIGFGSGFKCNSVVWKCINRDVGMPKIGAWADCIHEYPVLIPEVVKL